MFGLATWIKLGAALAVLAALAISHGAAFRAGKSAVLSKLASDRITVLQDGRKIDEDVLGADDGALCALLGGCLPDEGDH
jgi:hypothetical protein|uniref:Uncharacterized protein n=1 Tax=Chelativorans sp. (strain BNC1) TaxID=266779 RepID=Q11IY8_CHESB